MTAVAYLAVGFAVVWVLLACYLFWLGRLQLGLEKRLAEIESRSSDLRGG